MRNQKKNEDYEKTNVCFICNLDKYIFQKNSIGFNYHITKEHVMWNYIFFMYSLKKKASVDMNGIESYVKNKIATDDITWVPIRRALSLESSAKKDDKLNSNLVKLRTAVKTLIGIKKTNQ